jgi:hypothetical protein
VAMLYSEMFYCQVGLLPMKCLGVLVTFLKLKNIDWEFLDAMLIKKLDALICDSASYSARLTLLEACLSGIFFLIACLCFSKIKHSLRKWISIGEHFLGWSEKEKSLLHGEMEKAVQIKNK